MQHLLNFQESGISFKHIQSLKIKITHEETVQVSRCHFCKIKIFFRTFFCLFYYLITVMEFPNVIMESKNKKKTFLFFFLHHDILP